MPNINLSWVPANTTNSIGQTASAIARVNGTIPNMTTGFTPTNNMGKAISTAVFNTNNFNIVYKFIVQNICSSGGPTPNTNGVKEAIVFKCIFPLTKSTDVTTTSYTITLLKGAYNIIDGVNYPNYVSSIEGIEFTLYNGTNTGTPLQGPFLGVLIGTGNSEAYTYTFSNLTSGTSYVVRSVLLTTIDGVLIRSDAVGYLGVACNHPITTNSVTTPPCRRYKLQNFQTGQGQFADYTYTDCTNNAITATIQPNTIEYICAIQNTVVFTAGAGVATDTGAC